MKGGGGGYYKLSSFKALEKLLLEKDTLLVDFEAEYLFDQVV